MVQQEKTLNKRFSHFLNAWKTNQHLPSPFIWMSNAHPSHLRALFCSPPPDSPQTIAPASPSCPPLPSSGFLSLSSFASLTLIWLQNFKQNSGRQWCAINSSAFITGAGCLPWTRDSALLSHFCSWLCPSLLWHATIQTSGSYTGCSAAKGCYMYMHVIFRTIRRGGLGRGNNISYLELRS